MSDDMGKLLESSYLWETCQECGGIGYHEVPDNGTNYGEEKCDVCNGEGRTLVDQFGEPQP